MPKGISLHVGVNEVRPTPFNSRHLVGCVNDAVAMRDIAEVRGFKERILLPDDQATYDAVTTKIREAAKKLDESGDIFLFTFSGHGSYRSDDDFDELDRQDEALVLHDYMLFDDVLERELWPLFEPGVRVLMIADSCYSGTVSGFLEESVTSVRRTEGFFPDNAAMSITIEAATALSDLRQKMLSEETRRHHFEQNRDFYEQILKAVPPPDAAPPINASVLLLAACQDDEGTGDGLPNSVFTTKLLQVWKGGSFSGTYEQFRKAIGDIPSPNGTQHPTLTPTGKPDAAFLAQQPFRI